MSNKTMKKIRSSSLKIQHQQTKELKQSQLCTYNLELNGLPILLNGAYFLHKITQNDNIRICFNQFKIDLCKVVLTKSTPMVLM